MALNVVDLEIGRDDVVYVRLLHGTIEIEAMFYAHLTGRVAIFSRLDILGAGPNTLGWSALRELAQSVMELLDVDELRIEGAARTSGAGPGRRPAPPFSGELVTLVLRLVGPLDKGITVAKRLRAAGLTLRAAHAIGWPRRGWRSAGLPRVRISPRLPPTSWP
jgi:hypothetical protein